MRKGAAAASASVLGLNPEQTVWALGNAGTQAAGLWQVRFEPVMSKQLHTAHAAWSGLTAASLAQSDFTGPQYILEGPRGLFAAMCDGGDGAQLARSALARDLELRLVEEFVVPAAERDDVALDEVAGGVTRSNVPERSP